MRACDGWRPRRHEFCQASARWKIKHRTGARPFYRCGPCARSYRRDPGFFCELILSAVPLLRWVPA